MSLSRFVYSTVVVALFLMQKSEAFIVRGAAAASSDCCLSIGRISQQQHVPASRSHGPLISLPSNGRQYTSALWATSGEEGSKQGGNLPFFLDPGTKGGALFLSLVLFIIPIILYSISLSMGMDMIDANRIFGIGFTVLLSVAWVSTYIFRVATKDMTYVSGVFAG